MKTRLKNKRIIIAILIAIVCCTGYACKKTENREPVDNTGLVSSNVAQYTFGVQDFTVASYNQLAITTTRDTADNSAWFVYLYSQAIDRWYVVPGYGNGGITSYRLSLAFKDPKFTIYIDKVGAGEKYEKAKVIRVYSKNGQDIARIKDDREVAVKLLQTYQ